MSNAAEIETITAETQITQKKIAFIVVVKKTFRLRNAFFVTTLMPPSFIRNIIMTIGIVSRGEDENKKTLP
jgi:hypothetical protein